VTDPKSNLARWRGLATLVRDGVEHATTALRDTHLAMAQRPFTILEQVPSIAEPARIIHRIHDGVVATSYDTVRAVTRLAGTAAHRTLDLLEEESEEPTEPKP